MYTDYAVFKITPNGVIVDEIFGETTLGELETATGLRLRQASAA